MKRRVVASEIREIYDTLQEAYGPQLWWPAETAEEVVIGAILTQNTAWANVVRAIDSLRSGGMLTLAAIRACPESRLAERIKPAGTYRIKASRLKAFVDWLYGAYDGSLDVLFAQPLPVARAKLLSVKGIGPETADAILLYAGGLKTFVVDAYTRRVLRRHFMVNDTATYGEIQAMFESSLPADAKLYNEYHALLVAVGKHHCRSVARCDECPLASHPHDETL